jgi:hypothetical protein
MSVGSPARRFALASGFTSGRASVTVLAALLIFLLAATADAYTLVLRSGRHVNVPDDFRVTPSAVVYETSPGFSVTVWLTNVDVAATERANAETAGSFARRITQGAASSSAAPAQGASMAGGRAGTKVITNKELEPLRLRREAQEAEYERTRGERGMPSKQELRRRFEEQDRRLRQLTLQMQAERAESELESMRSELFNVRRELNELGSRLSQQTGDYAPAYALPNYPYYYAPPALIITRAPFGRRGGFGRGDFGPHTHGRARTNGPWQGRPFPTLGWPTSNGSNQQPAMATAPAMPAPRR